MSLLLLNVILAPRCHSCSPTVILAPKSHSCSPNGILAPQYHSCSPNVILAPPNVILVPQCHSCLLPASQLACFYNMVCLFEPQMQNSMPKKNLFIIIIVSNRKRQTSKVPLESQAQGTSLFSFSLFILLFTQDKGASAEALG